MIERHYDTLKNYALLYLPGLGTLYFTIASIWHLPWAEEIVGTIAALDTFLGVILKISTQRYTPPPPPSDGQVLLNQAGDKMVMNLNVTPDEIAGKKYITLAVDPAANLERSQGKQAL